MRRRFVPALALTVLILHSAVGCSSSRGEDSGKIPIDGEYFRSMALSHEGTDMAIATDHSIYIYEVNGETEIEVLPVVEENVVLAYLPTGQLLIATKSGLFRLNPGLAEQPASELNWSADGIVGLSVSPDADYLAVSTTQASAYGISIVSTADYSIVQTLPHYSGSTVWSSDSRYLGIHFLDNAWVVEVNTGELQYFTERSIQVEYYSPIMFPYASDAKLVGDEIFIAESFDRDIAVWDKNMDQPIDTMESRNTVSGMSWSPDGTILAIGSDNGNIELWNTDSHTLLRTLNCDNLHIYSLRWSGDSSTLAAATVSEVCFWRLD